MVRLHVALGAAPRRAQAIAEALQSMQISTRLERGCLGCSVWQEGDGQVHYSEEWATEDDLQARVRSPRFVSLISLMEAASEPPKVQFQFVERTRGLEYVEEVRGPGD